MTQPKPQPFPCIYQDGTSLYLEWPTFAQRFPFTEAGLHKALAIIPHVASAPSNLTGRPGNLPNHTKNVSGKIARISPTTKRRREVASFTPEQRQGAAAIARKLKPGQ